MRTKELFRLRIWENEAQIGDVSLPDPFHTTIITVKPDISTRLRLLFGRPITIKVRLGAAEGVTEAVMQQIGNGYFERAHEWAVAERKLWLADNWLNGCINGMDHKETR